MDSFEYNMRGVKGSRNTPYEYNESSARAKIDTQDRPEGQQKPIAILCQNSKQPQAVESAYTCLFRIFEIIFASVVLTFSLPVLLIIAIVIKLESDGPALFGMSRAGKHRRVAGRTLINDDSVRAPEGGFDPDAYYWIPTAFTFYKFRTMYSDAAERFPEYYWWNYELTQQEFTNMFYKVKDDPRLTQFGKWLRKSSLDELPNFWHVLTGHAAIVGPRPEAVPNQAFYTEDQMRKFTVKPGLTCLSKVHGRGDLSVGEQITWDLEYVDTRSVWLDVRIICRTVWLVLTQRGSF